MTSPYLLADLRRDEGCRLEAYPDPLSGGAPWTIGWGHTGPDVHPGLTWTQAQADNALAADVRATAIGLDAAIPWWRRLDDVRQDCLCELAFQLGVHGLAEFRAFLGFMREGKWAHAALDLSGTQWARQTRERAERIIAMIRTGERRP